MPSKQALEVKQHWETMAALGQTLPLDEQRDLIEKEWPKLTGEPRGVDFAEVDVDGLTAMWITPKGAAEDRTILAIHGGGYVSGSIYTHRKMFGHLAKAAGCRALSIEYRRTPEHVHPAAIEDVFGAYRWILRHGLEPRKVAFVGDSCGGGLALSALLGAHHPAIHNARFVMRPRGGLGRPMARCCSTSSGGICLDTTFHRRPN
jgi:monoterpene epsilon-lactone hydrolase